MGDYVTDLSYVRGYHPELAPAQLRAVAALNGLAPPPAERFSYCELGCGFGDTTVALAAANPDSSFVGIDLVADHVSTARRTASEGGVGNVTFLEQDFSGAAGGPFDYVVAHGVFSWVGPEVREALIDFARRTLRPGGLLYVSYNALPAWAAVVPLRRLLFAAGGTTSLERAERGLALAKKLAGGRFFAENPPARSLLELMEKGGPRYVAHEFLNAHWAPLYFSDVARLMLTGGLAYVGSLPYFTNYRNLVLPDGLALDAEDRVEFESLKDYAVNTYFRCDVFAREPGPRSPDITQGWLSGSTFALAPTEEGRRDIPLGDAGAALERLAEGSASGLDPHLALRLFLAERIVAVNGATLRFDPEGTERYSVPLAYNRMVLERPYSSELPIVVASPVTGAGIRLGALEAVALRLVTEIAPGDRDAFLVEQFGTPGIKMSVGDRVIEETAERLRVVREGVRTATGKLVPRLVELGVLEPT